MSGVVWSSPFISDCDDKGSTTKSSSNTAIFPSPLRKGSLFYRLPTHKYSTRFLFQSTIISNIDVRHHKQHFQSLTMRLFFQTHYTSLGAIMLNRNPLCITLHKLPIDKADRETKVTLNSYADQCSIEPQSRWTSKKQHYHLNTVLIFDKGLR